MAKQKLILLDVPAERMTRRQHKHDLWLTFMANATTGKSRQAAAPKLTIFKSLLSIFL